MTREDREDLYTACTMIFPCLILLILGIIVFSTTSGHKVVEDNSGKFEAIENTIGKTEVYQFEWPTGVVETYNKKDIKKWVFYPETNYIEFTTSIIEKDGWGSSNETIGVFGIESMELKDGIVVIKAGPHW